MDIDGFREVARSLSLYHRITEDKLWGENNKRKKDAIEKLYVDLLPNNEILHSILEEKTTFLVGRKGTGKSTIFARAQYQIHKDKKYLSVYINAKTIYRQAQLNLIDIKDKDLALTNEERLHITLIKHIIKNLLNGMIEELKNERNNIIQKLGNHFRDGELDILVDQLDKMLNSNEYEDISKLCVRNNNITNSSSNSIETNAKVSVDNCEVGISSKGENGYKEQFENTNILVKTFDVGNIINKFLSILEICKRKAIYIFIDDYSELGINERTVFMDTVISPMYDIGVDKIHFKIACYPNKIEPIKLERAKYLINQIDLFEVYGGNHNSFNIQQKAIEYTKKLLSNSVKVFCKSSIEEYFDTRNTNMDEFYRYLYYVSQNVPRVLGLVLYNCYLQATSFSKVITISVINEASRRHYEKFIKVIFSKQPGVRYDTEEAKVDMFVQKNIVDELINMAQKNKYNLPVQKEDNSYFNKIKEANTSHFTLSEEISTYVDDLEFNGFIHKVNKLAAKSRDKDRYKNTMNFVYALDYGLCMDEKLLYGRPQNVDSKYYQQRCFVYDDVIFTVLNNNKKIVCKKCGAIFPISDLAIIERFGMKCQCCPNGICEVRFDEKLISKAVEENSNAVWSDQEFEVANAIDILSKEFNDNVTVKSISEQIDYNYQYITSICKTLAKDRYIIRNTDVTPNRYKLSDRGKDIINILNR